MNSHVYPMRSRLRNRLDPNGTLPAIWLVPDDAVRADVKGGPEVKGYTVHADAGVIGVMAIGPNPLDTDKQSMWKIEKNQLTANRGAGIAAYVLAMEIAAQSGHDFCADTLISPYAKHRWEWLAMLGVATIEEPFRFSEMVSFRGVQTPFYSGFAIVSQHAVEVG